MGGKFKFQAQDSDLEYLFWQCKKHITLSDKKQPLLQVHSKFGLQIHSCFIELP